MMGFVDNIIVGNVSPINLAAASIANGFFFIIMVIGIGITYAISPLISMTVATDDKAQASKIVNNGFYVNLAVGIVLSILNYYACSVIGLLNQPPEVVLLAIPYCRIIGMTSISMMMFQNYRQFIEGLSIMRPAMYISVAANIVNAFANYVLVFGEFGFPRLGLQGSGIATFIARLLMAAVIIYYIAKSNKFKGFNLNPFRSILDFDMMKKILSVGVGSGFQYFFEVACFTFAAYMIGWLGAFPLAAHQIAISVATITYMAVIGFSAAGAIRVSGELGAGRYADARKAGISAILLAFLYMFVAGVIIAATRFYLPALYVQEKTVMKIASELLLIAAMFQVFDGVQATGLGVLRGYSDVKIPTVITFIAYWVISIPLGYILGYWFNYGIIGIWIGLLTGLATSAVLLTARFNAISKNALTVV